VALEKEAQEELDENLHLPTRDRPQTGQSVRFIAGTHSDYGTVRPAVPEAHQIQTAEEEINGAIYGRARDILEHADRLVLGFDVTDLANPELDGQVRPYEPINDPAVAAGEVPPTPREPEDIEVVTEEKLQTKKRSLWLMLFWIAMYNTLSFIGDIFMGIYDLCRRKLSIKILGKRISIGKYIGKPFKWVADLFYRWADYFEDKAFGIDPKPPTEAAGESRREDPFGNAPDRPADGDVPVPPPVDVELEDFVETGPGPTGDPVFEEDPDIGLDPTGGEWKVLIQKVLNSPNWKGTDGDGRPPLDSGIDFVMHANQIVQSVRHRVERPGNEPIKQAVEKYERARLARGTYAQYGTIARELGVDLSASSERDTDAVAPSDGASVARPNDPFDC
jgi:hypothetical protein